jgi:hypothetical protein
LTSVFALRSRQASSAMTLSPTLIENTPRRPMHSTSSPTDVPFVPGLATA